MGVIMANCFLIFLNKEEGKKILAILLMVYLIVMNYTRGYTLLTLEDYIDFYSILSLFLCIAVLCATEFKVKHKPYFLSENIPLWLLDNLDSFFTYGVFCIAYEQCMTFDMSKLCFKEYALNLAIFSSLILF